MSNSGQNFKKNLNSLYVRAGYTQVELGRKLGVSYVQVRKYLEGISSPPFEMIDKIASVFGVKVSDLFSDKDEVEPRLAPMDIHDAVKVVQEFVNAHDQGKSQRRFQDLVSQLSEEEIDDINRNLQEQVNKKKP